MRRTVREYHRRFDVVDAVQVAAAAMGRAKSLRGPDVRDAIAQTKDFVAVTGTITLDQNRNAVKPAVVLKVTENRAVYTASIAP